MTKVTQADIDTIDAKLTEAHANKLTAVKLLAEANASMAAAQAKRGALVQAVLNGSHLKTADLMGVETILSDAGVLLRFRTEVDAAGSDAITGTQTALVTAHHFLNQQNAVAAEEAANVALYALCPHQPTDAAILAGEAGLLARANREATEAYDAAYSFWRGPANSPTGTPRQRVIAEGQDFVAWRQWAAGVSTVPGWQGRSQVRQVRIALAARDHFALYTKLELGDLIRLQGIDYHGKVRPYLRSLDGRPAPCVFAPLS